MSTMLEIMLSIATLALLSTGTFFVARKIRLPYTVCLVVVGLFLIPVSKLSFFSYLTSFQLTPDLLFFVFLPALIFESAYNINIKKMLASVRSISLLSVVSLLISALLIAFGLAALLPLVGYAIPFEVALLFGALISATDPVAVLALFKEYGAPQRLSLIFEGESLLNDGTAFALFLIVLEILTKGYQGSASVFEGLFLFMSMVIGGILLGVLMGGIFSKIIERVRNNEHIEITLTLIVAHLTFLVSEILNHHASIGGQEIKFSSIIATMTAAMVVGNYGRNKISPEVEEYMEKFWGYFAFLCNSIVFILIGLLIESLPIDFFALIIPALAAVVVVAVARAISVYSVVGALNFTKSEKVIPASWQHLLAWGSLRGALAVTMVLLIPDTFTVSGWQYAFTVKEFLIGLTIACIYFTLFIKATTIGPFMRFLKLTDLTSLEEMEREESKLLIYAHVLKRLDDFRERRYVDADTYEKIKKIYEEKYTDAGTRWKTVSLGLHDLLPRMLHIHAIGVQKHFLKILFAYKEVSETVFKKILEELSFYRGKIADEGVIIPITQSDFQKGFVEKITKMLFPRTSFQRKLGRDTETLYMYYRAKMILARKAAKELRELMEIDSIIASETKTFQDTITRYEESEKFARAKMEEFRNNSKQERTIRAMDERFILRGAYKEEQKILKDLKEKEIITPKLGILLVDEFAKEEIR
jgi:CPA1 family monovalent cation:H+ antiporter